MPDPKRPQPARVAPYTVLAPVYDLVMEHVDYLDWAAYVNTLLETHLPTAQDVLELGCGTGSLAIELCEIRPFRYLATDVSPDMLRVAEAKAEGYSIRFEVADLRDLRMGRHFDVALLLYDGINYLLAEDELRCAFESVRSHLRTGGLFIFDQSTPSNSINNNDSFEDSGASGDASFVRRSRYDAELNLHHTSFDITIDGQVYFEHHVQRAYTPVQMRALIPSSAWTVEAALDGFTEEPASETSERVHWILRAR